MKLTTFFNSNRRTKIAFLVFGTGSILWFLIRVVPKPSRATYPCMRASYPIMSAFVVYLIAMFSSMFLFKKNLAKYAMLFVFVLVAFFSFENKYTATILLNPLDYYSKQANQPIGTAKGVFPGRVVWVYNPAATNANMKNSSGDYWYMDKNCPQAIVDSMLVSGVRRIGGRSNVKQAWDSIFTYFNITQGRGNIGYQPGEKIAIKINLTNSCCNGGTPNGQMDASPQLVLAIIRQLVDVVGVAQSDIWMGDPYRKFRNEYYDKCHAVYPNVHYVDGNGGSGREVTVPSASQVLEFSDKEFTATLPQHYLDATYLINMPCLKTHESGGISIAAKNHQGSILNTIYQGPDVLENTPSSQSAYYMHYALPLPPDSIQGKGKYRHLVDYIGHKDLGGKTLLYIVDGLWSGRNWNGWVEKWKIAPFNNDYTSSLFLSQDAVAIESVCFDFLLAEYTTKSADQQFPYMIGADDYLKQAADPKNWPAGIVYDPEGDGTPIGSLGVYEHWNNVTNKQYSRNLGTGNGIELKSYTALAVDNYINEKTSTGIKNTQQFNYRIFPTPFTTNLHIETGSSLAVVMSVFNLQGQKLFQRTISGSTNWDAVCSNGQALKSGNYIIQLKELKSNQIIVNCRIIRQ